MTQIRPLPDQDQMGAILNEHIAFHEELIA